VDRKKPTGDGQARSLSNLHIARRHLDSNYEIVIHRLERGKTGLLGVFSLFPKSASNPQFDARVDDGSPGNRREPDLDIDIKNVTKAVENDFKANRNGYLGHHTDRSPNPNQRTFDVEIATPTGTVFEGEVSFNTTFSMAIFVSTSASVSVVGNVNRATVLSKIRNLLGTLCQALKDRL
jgi:hypothetical protein